jgi:hypothetical protein
MRHEAKRSDQLDHCLALWARALPDAYDPRTAAAFTFWSVSCVLFGKQFYKKPVATGTDLLPRPIWDRYIRETAALQRGLLATLPSHADALAAIVGPATAGTTVARQPPQRAVPAFGNALGPGIPVMSPGT